jgi:hypothetical protein
MFRIPFHNPKFTLAVNTWEVELDGRVFQQIGKRVESASQLPAARSLLPKEHDSEVFLTITMDH